MGDNTIQAQASKLSRLAVASLVVAAIGALPWPGWWSAQPPGITTSAVAVLNAASGLIAAGVGFLALARLRRQPASRGAALAVIAIALGSLDFIVTVGLVVLIQTVSRGS